MKTVIITALILTGLITIGFIINAYASHSVSPNACFNDGVYDGENNEFSDELYEFCEEYGDNYYNGFIEGCMSQDNPRSVCENATD